MEQFAHNQNPKQTQKPSVTPRKILDHSKDPISQCIVKNGGRRYKVEVIDKESEAVHMQYEHLAANFERYLSSISSKVLKDFKNSFSQTETDYLIGKAFLYINIGIDKNIVLKQDRSDIEDSSWENIQMYISGFGDIYRNLKCLRIFIETQGIHPRYLRKCLQCLIQSQELTGSKEADADIEQISSQAIRQFVKSAYDLASFLAPYYKFPEEKCIKQNNERILKSKPQQNYTDVQVTPLDKW